MGIETAERSFAELLAALGDLVVAHTRGAPADPGAGSSRALAGRYRARRRAFDAELDRFDGGPAGIGDPGRPGSPRGTAGRLEGEDARALANMRGALSWFDELEPTPGARAMTGGPGDEDPATVAARAALYRRYGRVAGALWVGPETLDRPTILARLATEEGPAARRRLFEAMIPLWRAVDGDGHDASPYRRLLRSSAVRWAAHGSPVEQNADRLGLPPGSIEATLQDILSVGRRMTGPGRVEPWDYRFAVGAASRRLDGLIPADALLDVDHRYLASLGADPDALGIRYDVRPRPGRPDIPVAFTLGMGAHAAGQPPRGPWTPRPPWVFATYAVGGLGNLAELLHESGHALHMAAVRTRPAFLDWSMADAAFLEGTADVVGWDADEPVWQRHWLGEAADPGNALRSRYGMVLLDIAWALFEIELHRHPDRRPNDVWTEITTDGMGIEPHPEWSWWAIRGQLIDLPGYLANYALSAIMAAAVRARTAELRGSWLRGDAGWYAFMGERLFAAGASRAPSDLLATFLGRSLSADPLLADLRRAG